MSQPCPTVEQLAAALRRQHGTEGDDWLAGHLSECETCRATLEELAGGSSWIKSRLQHSSTVPLAASEPLKRAMQALEISSDPLRENPAPPALDFLTPAVQPGVMGHFGPYEVLEHVASGGMGIVLKARDPGLNRVVALKILPPALAANSLARARFIREARAAAAVVHEHVVPIHAVDEIAGLPFLVMQFIQGRTLSERIRVSGPLPVEEILRIGAQTATGLAAAHAQGLIHRDVKPGNILLENGVERVKITDFGLARTEDDSSLTREGHIAGTPEYMSPEQAHNETVDQRADLFSFGCVLYEMATGVSAFRAENPLVALRRVCDEEPPPAQTLNHKLPESLSELVRRLMAKDPASRPQTAAEVAAELERLLAESQQAGPTSPRSPERPAAAAGSSRPVYWSAWGVGVALLTAIVWFAVLKPESESRARDNPAISPTVDSLAPFLITASEDMPEQEFATLAEAVAAAQPGAVIECRFNGIHKSPTLRLTGKPLWIRAAAGFEPVLTQEEPDQPLLTSDAGLVLEGLTLLVHLMTRPRDRVRVGLFSANIGIYLEDGPFLATHCRFEVAPDSVLTRPHPQIISLVNLPVAKFLHCEFACGDAFALDWRLRPDSGLQETAISLAVQDSIAEGNLIFTTRRGRRAPRLDLQRNTLSGPSLLVLREPRPGELLEVQASQNVFALDVLANTVGRAEQAPIESLLRWHGHSNAYFINDYSDFSGSTNHEQWLASSAVEETNSVSVEIGIQARLGLLTERTRPAEAVAFTLTSEERQRLKAQGWSSDETPGANPQKTGPGQPYHDWRNSPAYEDWSKLVREQVHQSAAGH